MEELAKYGNGVGVTAEAIYEVLPVAPTGSDIPPETIPRRGGLLAGMDENSIFAKDKCDVGL